MNTRRSRSRRGGLALRRPCHALRAVLLSRPPQITRSKTRNPATFPSEIPILNVESSTLNPSKLKLCIRIFPSAPPQLNPQPDTPKNPKPCTLNQATIARESRRFIESKP